ncbi:hypothetical protein K523DRAFT_352245 [Schizophyllum commune Tattone D]|nr:hypothetical protein K523DRAFT_352245 [Schizophyllum commune Tattone D]
MSRRSQSRPYIPRDRRPYTTSLRQRVAISLAQSYTFNRSNIEAPWYGVQNSILMDLVDNAQSLLVVPQLDFDISSALWTEVEYPAAQGPEYAASPPAPLASTPDASPAPAIPKTISASQQTSAQAASKRVPIRDTVDADDTDELDWETEKEVEDDDDDSSYNPYEDSDNSDIGDDDRGEDDRPHLRSAERAAVTVDEHIVASATPATAQEPLTSSPPAGTVSDHVRQVVRGSPVKPRPMPRWDTSSAKGSDRHTIPDAKALRRYPDFCIVHAISEKMKELEELEGVDGMDEVKRQKYADLCDLWASRRTCHRCLLLIEEDKRGPSRREGCNVPRVRIQECIGKAVVQLVKYVAAYFYAVPDSPGVIIRPTAGIWWQELYVTPADAPAFDPVIGSITADPQNGLIRETLANKFIDLPLYRLRTEESDRALTNVREKMLQLARSCEALHPPKET